MGNKTGIEWTDSTWSPIRARVRLDATDIAREKGCTSLVSITEKMAGRVGQHCEHVSPGCEHCYAETNNHRRLPGNGTGLPYDRRSRDLVEAFVDEKVLLQPLRWRAVNSDQGSVVSHPRRIFVENQSDLFGEWVTDEMLDQVFAVMALRPQHIFQVLTKRPERMLDYMQTRARMMARGAFIDSAIANALREVAVLSKAPFPGNAPLELLAAGWPLPNVWLGVSVENQAAADGRIPLLLQTPAAVRFVSCEPLLGPVELPEYAWLPMMVHGDWPIGHKLVANPGLHKITRNPYGAASTDIDGELLGLKPDEFETRPLDWVICGGESGPGARPMHPDWARSLRDQCAAAGVAFFFKQNGEWRQRESSDSDLPPRIRLTDAGQNGQCLGSAGDNDVWMQRIGKKAAGSLLDGVEHKEFPKWA